MAGWSSLPPDLVRRVGDRLLASGDLDYHRDMRGVCLDWRSATADPRARSAGSDSSFLPWQWVILDWKPKEDDDDNDHGDRLFLNVLTGRFLRRRLPLLRVHDLVSFLSGFLVIRDGKNKDVFHYLDPVAGYAFHPAAKSEPPQVRAAMADSPEDHDENEFHVESAGGEGLLIRRQHGAVQVFKKGTDGKPIGEPMKSIGCRAIFLGAERCLAVNADKLPTVDGNCVYYIGSLLDGDRHQYRDDAYPFEEGVDMYRYDLSNGREEVISSPVADYFDRLYVRRPFSLAQLLLAYCAWS
ncbi:unnamed protein product [Alopecurus aequalis]